MLNNTTKRTTKVKLDKIESFSWLKFIRQVRTEKGEWVYVLSDLASKSTLDHGSAVNFRVDSGLCLS